MWPRTEMTSPNALPRAVTRKTLFTDEHPAYPRAFSRIPSFPVNHVDRQVRKENSDHLRETVKFAKCPSALMARMAVYRFYHNCLIPRRVHESRRGNNETHAERAGLPPEKLSLLISSHWMHRCFLHKQDLGIEERTTWLCGWRNPGVHFGRYIPKYISL